jgi:hypothetical protein
MSRDTDQHEQLAIFEKSFKTALQDGLKKASLSTTDTGLFRTSRSRAITAPVTNPVTVELETLAAQITRLRDKLGEPIDSGDLGRYMEFCAKWDEQTLAHKTNVEGTLAKELLKILKA